MMRCKMRSGVAALALVLAGMACGFSASTANVADAFMARDPDGTEPVTVFSPDETFYLIVELANASDATKVKAAWTAIDVDDVDFDTTIDETELTTGSGRLTFDLTNDSPWPAGNYRVDLYLNGKLDRTLEFSVE